MISLDHYTQITRTNHSEDDWVLLTWLLWLLWLYLPAMNKTLFLRATWPYMLHIWQIDTMLKIQQKKQLKC